MVIALSEAPGIGRLLSENRFSVPNHQRDYSWSEDEVRELIEDITGALHEHDEGYFVGLMVFLSSDPSNLVVLDGQQRLATTVIIFSAIRSWLVQYDEYRRDADDIQRDYMGRRALGTDDIQPRLHLNAANHGLFTEYVLKATAASEAQAALRTLKRRDRNRALIEATVYVRKRIDEIAAGHSDRAAAAAYFFRLVKYMHDQVRVVKLLVPSDDMAYAVFETLNDRGLELSPLDLVKNHLFGRAAGHSSGRIKMMEDRWTQMMHTLSSVRSDNSLKVLWTSRNGRIRTRKLFDAFKRKYANAEQSNSLSIEMLEAAEQFAALESADDPVWTCFSESARDSIRSLRIVGSQQAHPVILAALARLEAREIERILRLIEICTVRYLLIGAGATGRFETRCAVLAGKLYSGEITSASGALMELKDVYPSDEEFEQSFKFKEESSPAKAKYILNKMEIEEQRKLSGPMGKEIGPLSLTIEHIFPKNPGGQWADVVKNDPTIAEECTHRLGNLCLLAEINRDLGNDGFAQKKEVYGNSRLATTKELGGYAHWDRVSIERRQAQMARRATGVWRFQ